MLICLLDIYILFPSHQESEWSERLIWIHHRFTLALSVMLLHCYMLYEWKFCIYVVTSINTDLVDEAHSVTLRTDTTYMHPEDLHCTAHKHKGRDADLRKDGLDESCKESCVKENFTLSCMFCIEHRCAVSVVLLKPENKSPSEVPSQMFRGFFLF